METTEDVVEKHQTKSRHKHPHPFYYGAICHSLSYQNLVGLGLQKQCRAGLGSQKGI